MPGNVGNDLGVGKYCTSNGTECGGFSITNAWICTLSQAPTAAPFCTKPCSNDGQCGTGAFCRGDTNDAGMEVGLKGCVPAACL
jgi:hypothetical protein